MADQLDILYVAWNRLAFTRASFQALLDYTEWNQIRRLVIYDDGSTDGTREFLLRQLPLVPVASVVLHQTRLGGATPVMNRFLVEDDPAPLFVKIDNDFAVCPGWVSESVGVMHRNPELKILGLHSESFFFPATPLIERTYQEAIAVGGVIMARTEIFNNDRPANGELEEQRRYGFFNAWQVEHSQHVKGYPDPPLSTFLLNKLPIEPWASLSVQYEACGWQRDTGKYAWWRE